MHTFRTACAAAAVLFVAASCSSSAPRAPEPSDDGRILSSTTSKTADGTVITTEMIGRSRGEMDLSRVAVDPAYGFTEAVPIKIGGSLDGGGERTYQYLNALRGPAGEHVTYSRIGTCCPFETPNALFGGSGLLEVFEIKVAGSDEARRLYFNWYDAGEVLIPVGLSSSGQ